MENRAYFWRFGNVEHRNGDHDVAKASFHRSAICGSSNSKETIEKNNGKCRWFWWKCSKYFVEFVGFYLDERQIDERRKTKKLSNVECLKS